MNEPAGITDDVQASMVRGDTPLRQTARNRIIERIIEGINNPPAPLLGVTSNQTAEAILTAIEALGWTPPQDQS